MTDHVVRFRRLRAEDCGYAYEGLAIAMVRELGWQDAQRVARSLQPLNEGMDWGADPAAVQLHEEMGWHQAVLFVAWFRDLDNYRDWATARAGGTRQGVPHE